MLSVIVSLCLCCCARLRCLVCWLVIVCYCSKYCCIVCVCVVVLCHDLCVECISVCVCVLYARSLMIVCVCSVLGVAYVVVVWHVCVCVYELFCVVYVSGLFVCLPCFASLGYDVTSRLHIICCVCAFVFLIM